jgi:cell division protein ZipA
MTELRWILLALGVLFVAGIALWELRRPRRTVLQEDDPATGSSAADGAEAPRERPAAPVEPTLTLPQIFPPDRDRLPVLEVADEALLGLTIEDPRVEVRSADAAPEEPVVAATAPAASSTPRQIPTALPPVAEVASEPIVDWPPEGERRVVSLRLVAHPNERFAGRNVRQALAAAGFVNGKLSIFHKAGPDGRALVSAASLTKPGTFDPELMDTQRFSGLNLFSVLPGPLPAPAAFDELLASARSLNERLAGLLTDASGEPLTQSRVATLRDELSA